MGRSGGCKNSWLLKWGMKYKYRRKIFQNLNTSGRIKLNIGKKDKKQDKVGELKTEQQFRIIDINL